MVLPTNGSPENMMEWVISSIFFAILLNGKLSLVSKPYDLTETRTINGKKADQYYLVGLLLRVLFNICLIIVY